MAPTTSPQKVNVIANDVTFVMWNRLLQLQPANLYCTVKTVFLLLFSELLNWSTGDENVMKTNKIDDVCDQRTSEVYNCTCRAFSVAGPTAAWNTLPEVTLPDNLRDPALPPLTFRAGLKTLLFSLAH